MADLRGRVVAVLEARRAAELAGLIERHGGVAYPGPTLQEIHQPESPELAAAVDLLCGSEIEVVVLLTGVGTTTLVEAARRLGREQVLLNALRTKRIAVRGPKPAAALRKLGVPFELQAPEPHTTRELLQALEAWNLRGVNVLVQLYGGPNPELRAGLEARGARVVEVAPYTWGLPADRGPALRLIENLARGGIDVLAGTSASQVANLFEIAHQAGREAELREALQRVPVAAQGPVCAAAFEREGIHVEITPEHGHMGALVLAVARHFDLSGGAEPQLAGAGAAR